MAWEYCSETRFCLMSRFWNISRTEALLLYSLHYFIYYCEGIIRKVIWITFLQIPKPDVGFKTMSVLFICRIVIQHHFENLVHFSERSFRLAARSLENSKRFNFKNCFLLHLDIAICFWFNSRNQSEIVWL